LNNSGKETTLGNKRGALPVGRVGEPSDVPRLISALCEVNIMTGQIVVVDGGMLLV
jgi:NAD(P)-dependent dehydrogenase (short-subunit alcohol dehydrogenase family)